MPGMMLMKYFSSSSESFNAAEQASVSRLAEASAGQNLKGGLDAESCNAQSCADYLVALEAAAIKLQIPPASRTYRANLPLNYSSLFPSDKVRSYRVDILEASLEHYNVIWVNGEKFEFTSEVTHRAEELQAAWVDLGELLERWSTSPGAGRPSRTQMVSVLSAFDSAWASFEARYISELVQIEAKARNHIVHASELEQRLQHLEKHKCEDLPEYCETKRRLVEAINHLNSVANVSRKGRDDLGFEILAEAWATIHKCNAAGFESHENANVLKAAEVLATDVVESFDAMRQYLRDVTNCLERVDPHLGNNSGLVSRLVDWEESWEVGAAYLQDKHALFSLCDAVAEIKHVQVFAPKLASMCEECDVELFMVLPRLVWLRFLAEPQQQTPLLLRLLPHRFVAPAKMGEELKLPHRFVAPASMGEELKLFSQKYAHIAESLASIWETSSLLDSDPDPERVRALLAKRVVSGGDDPDAVYSGVRAMYVSHAMEQVDGFIHELEAWSIELQRHCPEDWNQYSAVLVHCLSAETEKERKGPFGV